MQDYKIIQQNNSGEPTTIVRTIDNANIPNDPGNRDYRKYQEWLKLGNIPDPIDPPGREPIEKVQARAILKDVLSTTSSKVDALIKILDLDK